MTAIVLVVMLPAGHEHAAPHGHWHAPLKYDPEQPDVVAVACAVVIAHSAE